MTGRAKTLILIVSSSKDLASLNIRNNLLAGYSFEKTLQKFHNNPVYLQKIKGNVVKLITIDHEAIYYHAITDHFEPQLIIYISRHSSKSGTPTLSVHTPGNLGEAQKGGLAEKVSIAPANGMKAALLELGRQENALGLDYQVSYECTHHGPSLDVPAMFVELGSSPKQWRDRKAAEAVAHAAMAATSNQLESSKVALGIGGPHYNAKFTSMALDGDSSFGHMIPKYAISQVGSDMIRQCIERTLEEVVTIFLDWKGIRGADRSGLMKALDTVGTEVVKV